jgi:hypothetical protein
VGEEIEDENEVEIENEMEEGGGFVLLLCLLLRDMSQQWLISAGSLQIPVAIHLPARPSCGHKICLLLLSRLINLQPFYNP